MKSIAFLFDLDGTLLDSAKDITFALNLLAAQYQRPSITYATVCGHISYGSPGLLRLVFPTLTPTDKNFETLRQEFFTLYEAHFLDNSQLYPGVLAMLGSLDEHQIPWGIVTNKVTHLTMPLLKELQLVDRCKSIVCADTCTHKKPHPEPLLFACQQMNVLPAQTYFVGDGSYDYLAARHAGIKFIAALYGYSPIDEDPRQWNVYGFANTASDILEKVAAVKIANREKSRH